MAENNVTLSGRLSFPVWTMDYALKLNAKSQYRKTDEGEVAPTFNIFLEQDQLDKLVAKVRDEFLPWVVERDNQGQKKNALPQKEADKLLKALAEGDWLGTPFSMPIKGMKDKDLEVAPEAVAFVKIKGNAGMDLVQKAVVNSEDELIVPSDNSNFPRIVPIQQSVHTLYSGAVVATTVNIYAFMQGKNPGFAIGSPNVVFKADAEQIGGTKLDEDEIFLD